MTTQNLFPTKICPPECDLNYNPQISFEEIELCFRNQTPICGIITSASPEKEECTVALSNLVTATLPFKECVVQTYIEMTYINKYGEKVLSNYCKSLIGKKVNVTITKLLNDSIEVSRKPSLKKAFNEIFNECCNNDKAVFLCNVLSFSTKAVFVDMGGGILGFIPIINLSFTEYHDLNKWITVGEKFYAELECFWADGHFTLSRKAFYSRFFSPENYKRGEYVTVRTSRIVSSNDGYFVELPQGMIGIMDSCLLHEEGDTCVAIIRKVIKDSTLRCGFRIHLIESN